MPNISTAALLRNALEEYVRSAERTHSDIIIDPRMISFDIASNLKLMGQLISNNRVIALIRALRWTTGWDLRTCKRFTDLIRDNGANAFSMLEWI